MTPDEVADRYFGVIRNRDVEGVVALHAPDATITLPNGTQIAGQDDIRAFQIKLFASAPPIRPRSYASQERVRSRSR